MKTTDLTKGALLAALTALFALSFIYLPLFSVFGMFFGVCTVVILVTHISSVKISVTALAVSLILVALLSDFQNMIFSGLLMIVLPGAVLGIGVRNRQSMGALMIMGSISYLIAIAGTILFSKFVYGIDFVQQLRETMEQTVPRFISAMESVPELSNSEGAKETLRALPSLVEQTILMIPSALMIAAAFLSLCSILLTGSVLRKLQKGQGLELPTFSQLHLPKSIAYGYFGLMIAGMFFARYSSLYYMIVNVTSVLSSLLLIGGISLIKYLINKIQAPKGVSFLILLILLPFVLVLSQPITLLGALDAFWDFRAVKPDGKGD